VRPAALGAVLALAAACGGGSPAPHADRTLADGTHFGFVTAIDRSALSLELDEADLLTGVAATRAATEDGAAVTLGGHYVDNASTATVEVPFDRGVRIRLLVPCCELHDVALADWLGGFVPDARSFYGTSKSHYDVTVDDGEVIAVEERIVE
jgi:hypothetical protein